MMVSYGPPLNGPVSQHLTCPGPRRALLASAAAKPSVALPEVDVDTHDDREDRARVEDLPEAVARAVRIRLFARHRTIREARDLFGRGLRRHEAHDVDQHAREDEEEEAEIEPVDVDEVLHDARPLNAVH